MSPITTMSDREIELARKVAIYESEAKLRGEYMSEIQGVRTEVQAVDRKVDGVVSDVASVKSDVGSVKTDVANVKGQLTEVLTKLDKALTNQGDMKGTLADTHKEVKGVSNLAISVEEETPDGRRIVKKFKTWGQTIVDIKTIVTLLSSAGVYQIIKLALTNTLHHYGWIHQ